MTAPDVGERTNACHAASPGEGCSPKKKATFACQAKNACQAETSLQEERCAGYAAILETRRSAASLAKRRGDEKTRPRVPHHDRQVATGRRCVAPGKRDCPARDLRRWTVAGCEARGEDPSNCARRLNASAAIGHVTRIQEIMNLLSLAPEIQEEMSRPRSWAADSSSCDGSTRASLAIVTDEREGPIHAGAAKNFWKTTRIS